jgi:hypothetical protein
LVGPRLSATPATTGSREVPRPVSLSRGSTHAQFPLACEHCRGQSVLSNALGRLAAAATAAHRTSLAHDPVTLKRGQVRADAVVGEVELPGKLLDGATTTTQQGNHLPARALEKLLIPICSQFVPSISYLSVAGQIDLYNKSNKYLTYCG